MSEPFMHDDRTLEGLPRCRSIFKPSEQETIRCELTDGHEGEHSSQWEWSDDEDEGRPADV
jgi:hypothetical protein